MRRRRGHAQVNLEQLSWKGKKKRIKHQVHFSEVEFRKICLKCIFLANLHWAPIRKWRRPMAVVCVVHRGFPFDRMFHFRQAKLKHLKKIMIDAMKVNSSMKKKQVNNLAVINLFIWSSNFHVCTGGINSFGRAFWLVQRRSSDAENNFGHQKVFAYRKEEPFVTTFGLRCQDRSWRGHRKKAWCSMHFFQNRLQSFRVSKRNSITSCWCKKNRKKLQIHSFHLVFRKAELNNCLRSNESLSQLWCEK